MFQTIKFQGNFIPQNKKDFHIVIWVLFPCDLLNAQQWTESILNDPFEAKLASSWNKIKTKLDVWEREMKQKGMHQYSILT